MKPRKKSNLEPVLVVLYLLAAIYASFCVGLAIGDVKEYEASQGIVFEGFDGYSVFEENLTRRLENPSLSDMKWDEHTETALTWGLFIWFISVAMYFNSKRKYIRGKEFGTAEWGGLQDIQDVFAKTIMKGEIKQARQKYRAEVRRKRIKEIKEKYKDADAILTQTEHISIFNYLLNNNVLILGGSGSGKTRGYCMPNILQAHSSWVITDPKGELLEKAGYFLKEIKGYKLRVLNLDNKARSDGYNPFAYIHPEREGYEERVLTLIETIISNTNGGDEGAKHSGEPFWEQAEKQFLQSLFFFTCDGFVPEERNMNTVLHLLGMLEISEDGDNYDSDFDYFARIFEERYGSDNIGLKQYKMFRSKAKGKTASSIVMMAVARLAPFQIAEMQRILSYDSMELDRVGEEKTALFVVVPPTDTTFNFCAGMLFSQLFQELQYCATQVHKHDGQRLPVPVRFLLDEFANTCKIPNFTKILAYARSFGIGIVVILQSLEQIKAMYKDEWGVIVDNCNALLCLGSITHTDTLEYLSKLLGKGTFDKRTTGKSTGRSGSSSQNFDVIGRELMTADEIRKLPKSDCLLIVSGRRPFYSKKYDYTQHPNYLFTSDGNHAYSFEYTPLPPPKRAAAERRSDAANNERLAESKVCEIIERAEEEAAKLKMSTDIREVLTRMGQDLSCFVPMSDELLGADEEESALVDTALIAILNFEKEDRIFNDILKEVNRKEEENAYSLITDPKAVALSIAERGENLVPISDDILARDDEAVTIDEEHLLDAGDGQQTFDNDWGDLSADILSIVSAMEEQEEAKLA